MMMRAMNMILKFWKGLKTSFRRNLYFYCLRLAFFFKLWIFVLEEAKKMSQSFKSEFTPLIANYHHSVF